MTVTATTTKAQILTSNKAIASSADRGWIFCWSSFVNLLLQDRGDKVFRASLRKLAARFLAAFSMEVVRVLAVIPVLLVARG
jgi:hypothetical protein